MKKLKPLSILWAVRVGAEDWQEEIITTDRARIAAAKEWAKKNGFDRFRVSHDDGTAPDFSKTVNETKSKTTP